jgi:hypothetical protein
MPWLLEMFDDAGLVVKDLRWGLPTNPNRKWSYRHLSDVKGAVIHHTAGKPYYTAKGIAEMHIRLGWPGMAYTFYVRPNGEIDFCHRLRDWGPHAGGAVNMETFGIALAGNFVAQRPNLKMLGSLVTLIEVLKDFLKETNPKELYVIPHRQVSATQCPGLAWKAYLAAAGGA